MKPHLCDTVALIQNGKFLSIDTPEGTVSQFKKPLWAVKSANMYQLQKDLRQYEGMASVYPFGEYYHLALNTDKLMQEDITRISVISITSGNRSDPHQSGY